MMDPSPEYADVRKKVKRKKGFLIHLGSYVIVMAFLFLLNMITTPGYFWFLFPLLGWGVGLAFHYFGVYGWPFTGAGTKEWEEKQIEREIRRLEGKRRTAEEEEEYLELKEYDPRRLPDRPYDNEDLV